MPHRPTLLERIEAKVIRDDSTGCWNFTGALRNGYGVIGIGPRLENGCGGRTSPIGYVHRLFYAAERGPIPDGLHIDHLCRNRRCCNPDHLEPVTQRENNLRACRANRRTACRRGHDYVPGSYYRNSRQRVCMVCRRAQYAKQKEAS